MNTNKVIYNGLSIRSILKRLPFNMVKDHKKLYINNCIFVYKNERTKNNLGFCQYTRDANFNLINLYLNL